jgi:hypothetical protein
VRCYHQGAAMLVKKEFAKPNDTSSLYEVDSIADANALIEKVATDNNTTDVMVAFDLDNTVLTYDHDVVTDPWFDKHIKKITEGKSKEESAKLIKDAVDLYEHLVHRTHLDDVSLVEPGINTLIDGLQNRLASVIGLTSRGVYVMPDTFKQLNKFGIDFNKGTFKDKKHNPQVFGPQQAFEKGIIFTDGKNKGEALTNILLAHSVYPRFIVMLDDKPAHLERIQEQIHQLNLSEQQRNKDFKPIQFIGIRCKQLDHKLAEVNLDHAQYQVYYSDRLLSNDHAADLHKSDKKRPYKNHVTLKWDVDNKQVALIVKEYETYKKLVKACPQLEVKESRRILHRYKGELKDKLEFTFTFAEFDSIQESLSSANLIHADQLSAYKTHSNPQTQPPITLQFNQLRVNAAKTPPAATATNADPHKSAAAQPF